MASTRCFDEILQCSICMEIITDPRALPCLHSYCLKCIYAWCFDKKPGSQAACPLCRQEFTIPNDGLNTLPKNFFIGNLLKFNQLKSAEAKMKLCDVCLNVEEDVKQADKFAKMFCFECQQWMCKSCSAVHLKMSISSSHKLVSLDEISTSGSGIFSKYHSINCDKHTDKKVEVFCFVCKTTLCMMCYIKDHNLHKCSDVVEVAGDFRISLKKDIQHLTMALETYDGNLTNINKNVVEFCEKVREVETEICTRSDQLHAEIDTEKRNLIDILNATVVNRQKEITSVTEEISQNKFLVQRSLNYCRELLEKGSDVAIAREADSLHTRAEELRKVKSVAESLKDVSVVDVSFCETVLTYSHPNSVLGLVTKKGVEPTLIAVSQVEEVVDIALLDDELFVSHVNVKDVHVYESTSLKFKRKIPVPETTFSFKESKSPSSLTGLATCSTNKCLYVSDNSNVCVFRFDISNTESNSTHTHWRVSGYPGKLAVSGTNHNVLVAYEKGGGIEEYSPTGTLIRSLFSKCTIFHAIELNTNTLAVSQWQPLKSILTTSKNGSVEQVFKDMPGDKCSLAADSYGNIVFCDKPNNRLQVVHTSLTSVRTLQLPDGVDLQSPSALCYDETERMLYVGEGSVFGQSDKSTGFRLLVFNVENFF